MQRSGIFLMNQMRGRFVVGFKAANFTRGFSAASAAAAAVETPRPHQYPIQVVENSAKPFTILDGKDANFYFNQITEKYGTPLGLADFNHLVQTANLPEHASLMYESLKIYESQGFDFSEEINSHFTRAIIRTGSFKEGITELGVYSNRIGAWATPNTAELLVKYMPKELTPLMIKSLVVMVDKGLIPRYETWVALFENLLELQNSKVISRSVANNSRSRLFRTGVKVFTYEQIVELSEKYNDSVMPTADAVEGVENA